jgi:exosortase D (VPLPA-CTERM-specific)
MKAAILHRFDRGSFGGVVLAAAVLLGLLAAVWHALEPLFAAWSAPEYSHAWLILPLAGLVFLHRLRGVRVGGSRLPGVLIAASSIGVMVLGWAAGSYTAVLYGAILSVCGFVWSIVGTQAMKVLAAPLTYLLFMVPIPIALAIPTTAEMQLLSSKLGLGLMKVLALPASLDGNIVILPSARLEVAAACSGLRYLFPLISFAFLVAMLLEDRFWKKALIVLSSIPIAIVTNASRIALIALLLERFGIDTTADTAHEFEGFAVFALCLVLLFIEVWVLLRIGKPAGRFAASDLLAFNAREWPRLIGWPVPCPAIVSAAILLLGTGIVANLPARVEHPPVRQPFALFPMEFGSWRGVPKTLGAESLTALGLTDYLLADYRPDSRDDAPPLNLYIAYYASQRNGLHAHSPQLCIPGGGWSIIQQTVVALPWSDGQSIEVNRVVIEKRGLKQVVYYWFEERGRHIAAERTLKYYALRDALFDNRSDGALVRIVAPLNADDYGAAADTLAGRLLANASSLFQAFVPGRVPHSSEAKVFHRQFQ